MTSQTLGARLSGSCARSSCRKVEPLRGYPSNENGSFNDRGFQGLKLPAPCVGQPQSSLEQFPQVNPHEKPAQRVQVRLEFQAIHQNRERRFDRRVAEIPQSGPTPRLGTQRLAFQQPQPLAQAIAQGPPPCRQTALLANPSAAPKI
jgi:hypothetical protein